jgi:hypothetical protein
MTDDYHPYKHESMFLLTDLGAWENYRAAMHADSDAMALIEKNAATSLSIERFECR